MAAPLDLYYYPMSHYCVSAERMLAYKRIPARIVPVSYHDKRNLIAATGQDYVPAIVDGGRVVTWREIPRFLDDRSPSPALFPDGQRGLAEALAQWGHEVLEERVWRVAVTRVPATLSDEVERWVFEEMQSRSRGDFAGLDQRRDTFRADLSEHYLPRVESMLDGREYVLTDPSVADFAIFGALSPLALVGEPIPPEFPRTRAWIERIRTIPLATTR